MTKTRTVLVVEDDVWLADRHVSTLRHAGFYPLHAPDAVAAMDLLDAHRVDAIVLDVLLTGPNAFALLHEIRSYGDLAAIPVILCTNSASDIATSDVDAYGVVWILDKTTMYPQDLVAAVKRALL